MQDEQLIEVEERGQSKGEDKVLEVIREVIIKTRINTHQFCRTFQYTNNIITLDKYWQDLKEMLSTCYPGQTITLPDLHKHIMHMGVGF